MRSAKVLYKGEEAGRITQKDDGSFLFSYLPLWLNDSTKPAISLTLPKTEKEYSSKTLFPFFFNMLPEGANKRVICRQLKIDETDHFGILLSTAMTDTIGAVTVKRIDE